jgi:nucleotidyltransferase/DNA polymerase involved in DNA repair
MILPVVEGHGEVTAVPLLIRRIVSAYAPDAYAEVGRPIRIKRNALVQLDGIENAVELAARQTGAEDGILVLLDADKDCPVELATELLRRAQRQRPDRSIRVVVAKSEFEAWFLASAHSLAGHRGLPQDLAPPPEPEGVRDAKGWLSDRTPRGRSYKPTVDQAALAQIFDLDMAQGARSFRKFIKDVLELARGPHPSAHANA